MPRAAAAGLERMRALAGDLPNALLQGFRAGVEQKLTVAAADRPVYAAGIGGSAVAADLAVGLVEAEASVPLVVVRSGELPRAVGPGVTVVVVSYSGTTKEALEAYATAGRRNARRVVVTSGGTLAEEADRDGVPVLLVPGGNPPRSAVGHLFGGVLGLLDPVFSESNERRVEIAADELRREIPRLGSSRGPAAALAAGIGPRRPLVLAERSFAPLARRWKTQLEENAKRLASFDELPEFLHNAVVGWDALPRREAAGHAVVTLEWSAEAPSARQAARYVHRLARSRGARALTAALPAEDRLSATVYGIALGDFVSLDLARRDRVDPYRIAAIERARTALASASDDD